MHFEINHHLELSQHNRIERNLEKFGLLVKELACSFPYLKSKPGEGYIDDFANVSGSEWGRTIALYIYLFTYF